MKVIFELAACAFLAVSMYASFTLLQTPIWALGLCAALWKLYDCGKTLAQAELEVRAIEFKSKLFNDTLRFIESEFSEEQSALIQDYVKRHGAELAQHPRKETEC